jgi:hypothetical protein
MLGNEKINIRKLKQMNPKIFTWKLFIFGDGENHGLKSEE